MLLFYSLVLLLVVENLPQEQVRILRLTLVLDLQPLLLVFEITVVFVQLLGHVGHNLQVLIQCSLAYERVLIVGLFLQRIIHQ